MIVIDKDGHILDVNDAFLELSGYAKRELATMDIGHFLPPGDDRAGMDIFNKVIVDRRSSGVFPAIIHGHKRRHWNVKAVAVGDGTYMGYVSDVTEFVQTESALQRKSAMLARTEEISHVGSWEWNRATGTVTWSDEMFRIFMKDSKDGAPPFEDHAPLFHPEDLVTLKAAVDTAVQTGKPYTLELRAIRTDGKVRHCLAHGFPEHDSTGRVIGLFGSFQDFTESKKAEVAIQESEERLKEAQRVAKVGSWELNLKTYHLSWSDEIYRMFEVDQSRFGATYEAFLNAIHPDDRELVSTAYETSVTSKTPYTIDHRLLMKSGEIKWVQENCEPFYDEHGNPIRSAGTVQDITERKLSEQALREREERYRAILHTSMDGFWLADQRGCILEVNDAYCRMSGYSREELLSMTVADIEAVMSPEVIAANFKKVIEKGSDRFMTSHYRKDKSVMYVEVSAHYQPFGGGRIVGFLRDITETKRLQELESRAERLETAGKIAGQVAHDFNNMLAPIMAYPEMIREQLPEGDPGISYLEIIEDSARKISELNQQLLTLSRRGHYNKQVLDLNTMIHTVLRSMTDMPDTVHVTTDLCPDLLPMKGGLAQVHQVVLNLLTNACDAVQNHGTISIRTENYYVDEATLVYGRIPRGEYVKLTVADSGGGIPDDIVQRIFDPFFTTKVSDQRRGSGLGLSVVDAVVRDHNGYIDLSTEPGSGTTFYIYFPTTNEVLNTANDTVVSGGSERLLIVDDDDIQRDVSVRVLSSLGYGVSQASSGEEAIALIKQYPQDLVVLDMIMPPGIDGAETYRRILEIHPGMKAIILSGHAQSERVRKAQAMGAGPFVRKPITRKILAAAVRNELDRNVVAQIS
jgi:PAS domain S-box-containing protein